MSAQESQTLAIEPSSSRGPADRNATGPRTELGKQRASHNATKHGVFSKVVVLKAESRAEYAALLEQDCGKRFSPRVRLKNSW